MNLKKWRAEPSGEQQRRVKALAAARSILQVGDSHLFVNTVIDSPNPTPSLFVCALALQERGTGQSIALHIRASTCAPKTSPLSRFPNPNGTRSSRKPRVFRLGCIQLFHRCRFLWTLPYNIAPAKPLPCKAIPHCTVVPCFLEISPKSCSSIVFRYVCLCALFYTALFCLFVHLFVECMDLAPPPVSPPPLFPSSLLFFPHATWVEH